MNEDVESIYIQVLNDERPLKIKCALWGLAELECKNRIGDIGCHVLRQYPSVRRFAIVALAKLQGEESRNILVNALFDQSPAVCKEAVRQITRVSISLSAQEMIELSRQIDARHTFIAFLSIARKLNKWDRLIYYLSLYGCHFCISEEYVSPIDSAIDQWDRDFNRSSIRPSTEQIERIKQLSDRHRPHLVRHCRTRLAFTLKDYGITW